MLNEVQRPPSLARSHGFGNRGLSIVEILPPDGSLMELETQLQIALRLDHATEVDVTRLLAKSDHVGKMLSPLKNSLNK